jgi:thermitase
MSVRVPPHHLTITGALALALCLLVLLGTAGPTRAEAGGVNFKTDEVIVRLQDSLIGNPQIIKDINAQYGSETLDDTLGDSMGVYLLEPPENSGTERRFADLLEADPQERVQYAEQNFVVEAPEDPAGDARHKAYDVGDRKRSKDPSQDYAAENLHLSCPTVPTRGEGSTVAVLDTGAQLDHPALKANFRGVARYDFVDDDTKPNDKRVGLDKPGGHGTHVAGIVDQVAPAAKIMPLRVLDLEGRGTVYNIARAIDFALMEEHKANVINLSLGTSSESDLLKDMVGQATDNGVVVVAAAGNSDPPGSNKEHYPAASRENDVLPTSSVDGLLAVTSVDKDSMKSVWANYGLWVDIAAPGESIRSTFPVDKYANWSGTSMATPFVSGQAALIHTVAPLLNPAQIEARIRRNARDIDLENPDYPLQLGAGHADVCASLED